MLCFYILDISERIDINKASVPKEYYICHYWYFLEKGFRFQPNVSNGCHDVLMISINLDDIAILNIRGGDYCCIITGITRNEAINLLQNADLTKKRGVL